MSYKITEVSDEDKAELEKLYNKVLGIVKKLGLAHMRDVSCTRVFRPEDGKHYIWVADMIGNAKDNIEMIFTKEDGDQTIEDKIKEILNQRAIRKVDWGKA